MEKILIVDDDKKICDITKRYLVSAGYDAESANNGDQAGKALSERLFSLVIFDVMLPDSTGFELLKNLRDSVYKKTLKSTDKDVPVIMLTALSQTQNVIKGLRAGADDYISKPFDPTELVERVAVILKRVPKTDRRPGIMNFGNLEIDPDSGDVRYKGTEIVLQRREKELLLFLAKNAGKTLSREQLLDHVWGFEYEGNDRAVDICIQRLRKKLKKTGAGISTVWGTGYRMEKI